MCRGATSCVVYQVAKEGVETEQGPTAMLVDAAQATAGALQSKAQQAVATATASASQAKQGQDSLL